MSTDEADDRLIHAWDEHRRYLLASASRILADPGEAEDVVQDAFARLALQPLDEIGDTRAWLVVVVRRLALDRLGSAHRRRTRPSELDPYPAGAGDGEADPGDRVTLDDEVRRAVAVVLDRLSPAERTAFLLHDVFGFPFEAVGELVGRSSAACRQLASRARRSIRERGSVDPAVDGGVVDPRAADVARRFAVACAGGDLDALLHELDPDVAGEATVDGRRVGFASGADAVAERVLFFLGPQTGFVLEPMPLEAGMAVVASRRGEPTAVVRLDLRDGRVGHLHAVVLPA